MATIKSYSDLEQSRKLSEILPLESADMYYFLDPTPAGNIYYIVIPQIDFGVKTREPEYNKGDIPCWSLAALLGVIPSGYVIVKNYHSLYFAESRDHGKSTNIFNNPVDACVAMIEKLHELNLL